MNRPPETIGPRLDELAAERSEEEAILFINGPTWSWAELQAQVRANAAGLQAMGIVRGELVLSWLPNGPLAVLNLLALNLIGAVYVPVNPAYRGGVLEHVIASSGARRMIAHGTLSKRLAQVNTAALETLVIQGPERPELPGITLIDASALAGDPAEFRAPDPAVRPWDLQMVIYTSGTTGPSKGVLSSYRHAWRSAMEFRNVGSGDRNLAMMPMFHVGGVYGVLWALHHGGSVVVVNSFRAADFWSLIRRYQVTTTGLLGSMAELLMATPPAPDDCDHTLRSVLIAPFGPAALAFAERFGVNVFTEFNMTELSVPMFAGPNPSAVGTCGVAREGVELRLVDEHDVEVPDGDVGELMLRTTEPWEISHGYLNAPDATARAWRNGWFHTGDLFRRDAAGYYYFVDRAKDALRRRGENISSFEVESAIRAYPGVVDVAVVGVPDDAQAEDEVLAAIVPASGVVIDPIALIEFLRERLAHFMVPRYLRMLPDLPRTHTSKVEKHRIRAEGVTANCWDREAAGLRLKREQLEART